MIIKLPDYQVRVLAARALRIAERGAVHGQYTYSSADALRLYDTIRPGTEFVLTINSADGLNCPGNAAGLERPDFFGVIFDDQLRALGYDLRFYYDGLGKLVVT